MSGGSYSQNFDVLGSTSANWTNNVTLPGWYATKGSLDATNFIAGAGTGTTGGIYSFGTNGVNANSDRALGSVAASSINYAYGVRFTNDTAFPQTNILVSYTGEEWRNGSLATTQALAFSFAISGSPITNAFSAATWSNFTALNFVSPTSNTLSTALDGNAPTNLQMFTNISLTGVSIPAGQELFLRWLDIDDGGNDHGLAIDDLTVSFTAASIPVTNPPSIITQPQSLTNNAGDDVVFSVVAGGTPPFTYQWKFNATNLVGETNLSLNLFSITTNQAGSYTVALTNAAGYTNSDAATLTVKPAIINSNLISYLHYNVKGNGATDWSTNSPQVQAICRQLNYLKPDIIAFNEIPHNFIWEMTNWVKAFLPGYNLATNSGSDNFINSVIATRFPITRSQKWLDGAQLEPWGYTNSNYTRDLFEAELAVSGFAQHLHVFTTHLKSSVSGYTDAAAKRAAEAAAVTNFFATNFFVLYPNHPYILSGDFNESDTNTLAIQRLLSVPLGLQLTNPKNPFNGSINTDSIQSATTNPTERIDYIMPCGVLAPNVSSSQVFRTDKLTPLPPTLLSDDDVTSSDHLPVFMVFTNPYTKPIRVLSLTVTNTTATFQWTSVFGGTYRIETSTNMTAWATLITNLTATSNTFTFTTNLNGNPRFFRIRAP